MIFQNFGFNRQAIKVAGGTPPGPWTPADLTGLLYYFTAGAGTTLVGSNVSKWTDQKNAVELTATTSASAYWPLYSASLSLANNKPALYFTNTSSPYQRLQNQVSTGLSTSDDFTVIGIMLPTRSGVADYQIYGGVGAGGSNFENAMQTSNPTTADKFATYLGASPGNSVTSVDIISANPNWHAITYKASDGEVKQYANNITASVTTSRSANATKSSLKLIAGDYSDGSDIGGLGYRNGWLMELIYLNAIPSSAEFIQLNNYVQSYYKPGIVWDGLIAYYDIGNPGGYSSTTLYDLSGNNNNATLQNGAAYSGSNGGVITLNGTDQYIAVPDAVATNINGNGTNQASIQLWLKLDASPPGADAQTGFMQFTAQSSGIGVHYPYTDNNIYINTLKDIRPNFGNPVQTLSNWHYTTIRTAPTTNGWDFYINSTQQAIDDGLNSLSLITPIKIGESGGGNENLQGAVGPILIYNRKITDAERAQNASYFSSRF